MCLKLRIQHKRVSKNIFFLFQCFTDSNKSDTNTDLAPAAHSVFPHISMMIKKKKAKVMAKPGP